MSRCRAEGSSRTCWRHRESNAGPSCLMSAASLSRAFTVLKPQADVVQRAFALYYPTSDDLMRGSRRISRSPPLPAQDVLRHYQMNGIAVRNQIVDSGTVENRSTLRSPRVRSKSGSAEVSPCRIGHSPLCGRDGAVSRSPPIADRERLCLDHD